MELVKENGRILGSLLHVEAGAICERPEVQFTVRVNRHFTAATIDPDSFVVAPGLVSFLVEQLTPEAQHRDSQWLSGSSYLDESSARTEAPSIVWVNGRPGPSRKPILSAFQ